MHKNRRDGRSDLCAVREMAGRRRRATYRVRNIRWLSSTTDAGEPGHSLLNQVQRAAQRNGISCRLLLALVLQETQFYHGRSFEYWWTELFLRATELRLRVFRDKSLGIMSIKPSTAVRLLQAYTGDPWSTEDARRVVARLHAVAVDLAALELKSFKRRGASDQVAFVAYGATNTSVEALLFCPDTAIGASRGLQRRSEHFREHLRFVREVAGFRTERTWLPKEVAP